MLDFIAPDPVAMHARLRPSSLACIDVAHDRQWTYRELDRDIQRAVWVLMRDGVSKGDRVAILDKNSVHQIILQQALMRMGAIFVPLNWRLSVQELDRLLIDCAPKILFSDDHSPNLPEGCQQKSFRGFVADVDAATSTVIPIAHSGHDVCIILYTSGTSGVPKGALLTSQFLLATGVNFNVLGEVDTGAVFLCDSPMFHVIGIVTQIWPPMLRGGTFIISPGFDPKRTNDSLGDPDLGVTHYFCVPQMADALRHAPNFAPERWTSLKALFTGGAPNPPANIRWWLDNDVRMVDGYGMTETGTTLGMPLDREILRKKAGSVGVCGPFTTVRIVDENDNDVPVGTPGEILIYGLNVTTGYWNRPEERAHAFTSDGWIRTGDLGQSDEDGFISIVGRRKDMFISGGENVFPVEIEAALHEHPAVREASIIGVPDERWGEVGRAYVILIPGQTATADDLIAHCKSLIASFKVPKQFHIVEDLPRTGSGKVMKHILRKEAAQA